VTALKVDSRGYLNKRPPPHTVRFLNGQVCANDTDLKQFEFRNSCWHR